MNFEPGQIIDRFHSKKNKEIILKIPKMGWEKQYQSFINSIIAEDDYIIYDESLDFEDENKFIQSELDKIKDKKGFCLTAFYQDEIIGGTTIDFGKGRKKHVATFGIAIKEGFREEGIGTKMMEILFEYVKRTGIRLIELEVFATNKRAIGAYRKMGFIKHGELPRAIYRKGKFVNAILMNKNL